MRNLKRLITNSPEKTIYEAVVWLSAGEQGRRALLQSAGSFIVVWQYGQEHMELSYSNAKSVRTPKYLECIAKYAKYMDATATTAEKNVDKPKEILRQRDPFIW